MIGDIEVCFVVGVVAVVAVVDTNHLSVDRVVVD
jgi:hypothetical protein